MDSRKETNKKESQNKSNHRKVLSILYTIYFNESL